MNKYCFILPCYQHAFSLCSIISELRTFGFKIFIVNDGSDQRNSQEIERVCSAEEYTELLVHSHNQGKGASVQTGFEAAMIQGYTHAIQIDSDGQHDLNQIAALINLAEKYPEDLISGRPVYDKSVPKTRLYARYATHIWVWIETLSFEIQDSMCGFRIYPLKSSLDILKKFKVGKRMDFDVEIVVRLFWKGLRVHQITVYVRYQKNGISHFNLWWDNLRITKMHTRLFFGMLPRMKSLIFKRRSRPVTESHSWEKIEEYGSVLGIKILIFCYRVIGRKPLSFILYFVSIYYSLISKNAQLASRDLRRHLKSFAGFKMNRFSTLSHIHSFANSAIDKFAVWAGDIGITDLVQEEVDQLLEVAKTQQGAFFLTSHYGNIEVCRALGRYYENVQFNALVYQDHAKRFNDYINKLNSDSNLNLICVKKVGPELSMLLKEKVDNKEWVFVVGDRVSVQDHQRTMALTVLGQKAHVSEGPFILAYLLEVPIYILHCFRQGKKFRLKLKRIDVLIERSRQNRAAYIQEIAQQYARELDTLLLKDPLQWYNFFDFWRVKS